jgi:hypothetical protein
MLFFLYRQRKNAAFKTAEDLPLAYCNTEQQQKKTAVRPRHAGITQIPDPRHRGITLFVWGKNHEDKGPKNTSHPKAGSCPTVMRYYARSQTLPLGRVPTRKPKKNGGVNDRLPTIAERMKGLEQLCRCFAPAGGRQRYRHQHSPCG